MPWRWIDKSVTWTTYIAPSISAKSTTQYPYSARSCAVVGGAGDRYSGISTSDWGTWRPVVSWCSELSLCCVRAWERTVNVQLPEAPVEVPLLCGKRCRGAFGQAVKEIASISRDPPDRPPPGRPLAFRCSSIQKSQPLNYSKHNQYIFHKCKIFITIKKSKDSIISHIFK
jgi:hypothetical protein